MRNAAIALSLSLMALAAPAAGQSKTVGGADLTKVFAGNTAHITHRNGAKQTTCFAADGKLMTTTRDGTKRQGTWSVKGDLICHDSSTPAKCYKVFAQNAEMTELSLQSEDFQWQPAYAMKAGNTENY